MGARAALATRTILSFTVTAGWSYLAMLTTGPASLPHLGRDLPADYGQLASAPTGNGWALFAVVAFIYAACLLVHGWRRHLRGGV
jgi:hypothetical protein